MGNVAASGGYYVAVDCDRIFALPNTVTGSIGVFGVKLDLTDFASRYGVQVDTVVSGGGPHTFTYSPLHPLTKPMKENFARNIDRYYDRFKAIVANGRCLPLEQVEDLAQGRVWTGEQAKKIGLVDELGGLDRALAYAKRKYTGGEDASVEVWPKRKSMWDRLLAAVSEDDAKSTKEKTAAILGALFDFDIPKAYPVESSIPDLLGLQAGFFAGRLPNSVPSSASGIMLTADENMAVQTALLGCLKPQNLDPWTAPGFWE
jgi:ClpP class serine protease